MESEPFYGNWNIHLTPQQKKELRYKIIRGGKIADQIRKMAKHHHEEHEVPHAEKKLVEKLQEAHMSSKKTVSKTKKNKSKTTKISFWQKILNFLKHIFLP